jgi:methyl-accepting chemotaxis protein
MTANRTGTATAARKRSFMQARFMRSLPVGVKLWVTTCILSLPLLGLGIFYVQTLSSTLGFTATEQDGYALYRPLDQVAQRIGQRSEMLATIPAGMADKDLQLQRLDGLVDAGLADFGKLDALHGNPRTHALFQVLLTRWQALKSARPITIEMGLASGAPVFDALSALTLEIGADWKLTLDPELSAYSLINVAVTKMPDARRFLTEARGHLAATVSGDSYSAMEGSRVTALAALFTNRLKGVRGAIDTASTAAADRPQLAREIASISKDWDVALQNWAVAVSQQMESGHPRSDDIGALLDTSAQFSQAMNLAQDAVLSAASTALQIRHASQARGAVIALSSSAVALTCGVLLMLALARRIAGAIKRLLYISTRIGSGHYDTPIDEFGSDEISRLFAGMSKMQRIIKDQLDTERAQAVANGRIRAALDNVSGCVMVADSAGKIIYTNRAIDELLQRAEADFRTHLPNFTAAAVRGSSIDMFHRQPQHQQGLLAGLSAAHTAQIAIGGRTFRMIANPVRSDDGARIGTVLEWADRTAELDVENETQSMLTAVLAGELGRRIDLDGKSGFFEVLGRGMNRLADNLLQIVSSVKATAGDVHRSAQEISQGNADLARRTEDQAASLARTAGSMEQMSATVKRNAGNADLANQLAGAAREHAQTGGAVVSQAVHAMADINESSKKIANIIGVINEISFQTNILALNAAVEAARAGEQGRGFAVVAAEVRNLAGRSAAAAQEIKELIADSVTKVQGGSELVTQSGATLEQIIIAVGKVTDVVAEIATASQDQSSGITDVTRAITEMDEVTQMNAALVEQASAAAQSMAEQAGTMTRMLAGYQTEEPASRTGMPTPARRAAAHA